MNSSERPPSGFRNCTRSPGLIFLPAFMPINAVCRFWGSFLVFCSAPLRSIRLATLMNDNRERHSNSVARIIMGCECFLMRAEWRTSLDF
jgi:hypothetical protein